MIRKITASGTPYQVGFIIGKKTKKEIQKQLSLRKKTIPPHKIKLFQKRFQGYFKHAQKFPEYLAEIKGMAAGSETDFKELFKFNLLEFWFLEKERCTSLVYQNKGQPCLFHNEDAAIIRNAFLADITYQNKVRILGLCYYGILPGIAVTLNNYGVSLSLNSLLSNDWRVGVPLSFIFRRAIESKTIEEGINFIKKTKRARSENFIFIDKENFINLETSATTTSSIENQFPFCHTNHYLIKKMTKYEHSPYLDHSQTRHKFCLEEIQKKPLSFQQVKKILSSHQNSPSAVCRHGEDQRSRTLASLHVDPAAKEILIAYGNPCQSKFYKFKLI